jgi:oxygen-independent coproporphyrinogen-3 oxidase
MAIFSSHKKTPLGIYVHIPFCRSKCRYCDFYSVTEMDNTLADSYLDALCDHIRETGPLTPAYQVDTIYFGGGTPSYFGAERLAAVLSTIRRSFDVSSDALDSAILLGADPLGNLSRSDSNPHSQ